jgi:hypothetical protein
VNAHRHHAPVSGAEPVRRVFRDDYKATLLRMFARLRPYILFFAGLTAVYHANLRPVDSSDSLPASLIPIALVLDHTVVLDRFVPWLRGHVGYTRSVISQAHGHYFSAYPIGSPLLVSPLYMPLIVIGRFVGWDPGSLVTFARIAEKFAATAIAALSAVLLLLLLKRVTASRWAWSLTLVYALATETWSISSQALWQHGPGELAIIGCLYCLERWSENRARNGSLWLAGACAAAAFIFRPTNLALLPAALAALLLANATLTQHLRLLAAPLIGALALASYNFFVFHRASGGYPLILLHGSILPGLAGLFLSPGRGLLVYTPVALFALSTFSPRAAAARRQHNLILVTSTVFIVLESLLISRSIIWWGGDCWGPRLLTELCPPLIVLMSLGVSAIDRPWPRRAFVGWRCTPSWSKSSALSSIPKDTGIRCPLPLTGSTDGSGIGGTIPSIELPGVDSIGNPTPLSAPHSPAASPLRAAACAN